MKRKLKINKKGFTMIELLVTIVILGLLSVVGITSVLNLQEKQRIEYNKSQNDIFVQTGKLYFSDNKSLLPQKPFSIEYVTLEELLGANYITDEFLDYDKKEFDGQASKVTVRRIGNETYAYHGELVSSKGDTVTTSENNTTIIFDSYKKGNSNITPVSNKYYTNNNTIVGFTFTNNDTPIKAYIYTIYKDDKVFKEGDAVYLNNKAYNGTLSLDLKDYPEGTYKVKLTTYDEYGYSKTKTSDEIVVDTTAPTIKSLVKKKSNEARLLEEDWTNDDIVVTGTAEDNNEISYWQYRKATTNYTKYSSSNKKTFTTTPFSTEQNENTYLIACDDAGNCSEPKTVLIKIDKTKPTKPVLTKSRNDGVIYTSTLNTSPLTITAKTTEKGSRVAYWQYGYENTSTHKIDYTKYKNSGSDALDVIFTTTPFTAIRNEYVYIRACDNAGNCSDPEKSLIKIQSDLPMKINVTGYQYNTNTVVKNTVGFDRDGEYKISDNWLKYGVTFKFEPSSTSGIKSATWKWNKAGVYTNTSSPGEGGSSNAGTGVSSPGLTGEGWRKGQYIVEENSGKKITITVVVKIDTTPPTCSIAASGTNGNNNWYKSAVNLTLNRSDSGSGISSYGLTTSATKTYNGLTTYTQGDTNAITWRGYVKDQAGNEGTCTTTFKVDKTAPTKPTVTGYAKKSSTDVSSAAGLTKVDSKKWTQKHLYVVASGSTDNLSGGVYYILNTSGQSNDAKDEVKQSRNVNIEGQATIKYKACDAAGNCSGDTTYYSYQDRTKPTCSITKSNTNSTAGVTLTTTCSDKIGECEKSKSIHTGVKSNKTYTVKDKAGNEGSCSASITSYQSCGKCVSCPSSCTLSHGECHNSIGAPCYKTYYDCNCSTYYK